MPLLSLDLAHVVALSVVTGAFVASRLLRPRAARFLLRAQLDELAEDLAYDLVRRRADPEHDEVVLLRMSIRVLKATPDAALAQLTREPYVTGLPVLPPVVDLRGDQPGIGDDPLTEHWLRLVEVAHRYASHTLPLRTRLRVCQRLDLARPKRSWSRARPEPIRVQALERARSRGLDRAKVLQVVGFIGIGMAATVLGTGGNVSVAAAIRSCQEDSCSPSVPGAPLPVPEKEPV